MTCATKKTISPPITAAQKAPAPAVRKSAPGTLAIATLGAAAARPWEKTPRPETSPLGRSPESLSLGAEAGDAGVASLRSSRSSVVFADIGWVFPRVSAVRGALENELKPAPAGNDLG